MLILWQGLCLGTRKPSCYLSLFPNLCSFTLSFKAHTYWVLVMLMKSKEPNLNSVARLHLGMSTEENSESCPWHPGLTSRAVPHHLVCIVEQSSLDLRLPGHTGLICSVCWGWWEGGSRREGFTYDQIKCKYMKHNFKQGGGVEIMCTLVRILCCSVQFSRSVLSDSLQSPWTASGKFFQLSLTIKGICQPIY